MSYCRWSTDNFACDLYCYESDWGWVTHVAGNRHVGDCPKVDPSPQPGDDREAWAEKWVEQQNAQYVFLRSCERQSIGLAFDGQTFNDPTLEAFRTRLLALREAGYRFPDHVIADVDEEIAEQKNEVVQL